MKYIIFFSGISPIFTEHLAEFDFVLTEISPNLTGISGFGEVSPDSWPNVKSVCTQNPKAAHCPLVLLALSILPPVLMKNCCNAAEI
jgi:hypothetical protein